MTTATSFVPAANETVEEKNIRITAYLAANAAKVSGKDAAGNYLNEFQEIFTVSRTNNEDKSVSLLPLTSAQDETAGIYNLKRGLHTGWYAGTTMALTMPLYNKLITVGYKFQLTNGKPTLAYNDGKRWVGAYILVIRPTSEVETGKVIEIGSVAHNQIQVSFEKATLGDCGRVMNSNHDGSQADTVRIFPNLTAVLAYLERSFKASEAAREAARNAQLVAATTADTSGLDDAYADLFNDEPVATTGIEGIE